MALTKCTECRKEVSTEAAACQHCGAPPSKFARPSNNLGKKELGIIALVLIGIIFWVASPSEDNVKQQPVQNDVACKSDLQCWGDKNLSAADVYCKDSIERQANYSVKWTDEGMFERKFSRFNWLDQQAGTLRYFGDKAQFQNGFGAYQNVIYECDIDPATNKILGVNVSPGHL